MIFFNGKTNLICLFLFSAEDTQATDSMEGLVFSSPESPIKLNEPNIIHTDTSNESSDEDIIPGSQEKPSPSLLLGKKHHQCTSDEDSDDSEPLFKKQKLKDFKFK